MKTRTWIAIAAFSAFSFGARAACPSDVDTAIMAARYANFQPAPNPPADLSMTDALCGRDKFIRFLGQNLIVADSGGKISLTSILRVSNRKKQCCISW